MKLLFDQNLSFRLVSLLREQFPDSVHVRDLGLGSALDIEVWDHAKQFGFAIVSKDSDFEQLALLRGSPPKVIWLNMGNCSTDEIVFLLKSRCAEILHFEAENDASILVLN